MFEPKTDHSGDGNATEETASSSFAFSTAVLQDSKTFRAPGVVASLLLGWGTCETHGIVASLLGLGTVETPVFVLLVSFAASAATMGGNLRTTVCFVGRGEGFGEAALFFPLERVDGVRG